MDDRSHAARFRELPALIAHPKELAVRSSRAAPAARLRASGLSLAIGIALVIVVGGSVVALAVNLARGARIDVTSSTIVQSHLGSGYPEHHGLAGPSRVGPSAGSWLGYPPHFGLAGPSRVVPSAGSWLGYPPHYGLAGPSHVGDGR